MNAMKEASSAQAIKECRHGSVLLLTIDNPPVNAFSAAVCDGIHAALGHAEQDDTVEAVVLTGAGKHFMAGFDLHLFDQSREEWPDLRGLVSRLDQFPKPVIAAMHGAVLGGGLELALACHYRLTTSDAQLGLPEINIGLFPAAGGSQRLPRLIGIEKSLVLMLTGKPILGTEAIEIGLADELCTDTNAAIEFAKKILHVRPLPHVSERAVSSELSLPNRMKLFMDVRKNLKASGAGTAANNIVDLVEIASMRAFTDGWAAESRLFQMLLESPESAALRHLFFAERKRRKVANLGVPRALSKVGIVGGGAMGGGIAIALLNAGLDVTLVEQSQAALDRGLSQLSYDYEGSVARGKLSREEMEANLKRLTTALDIKALQGVDLIIEAIPENATAKKALFTKLDKIKGALLATNTSALSIDELAAVTSRPRDVIGLHFFNPAHIMKLVEVVRGKETSPETLATALALTERLGKTAVVVGNRYGFVGNRMVLPYVQQARQLVTNGGLDINEIDTAMRQFGMKMGPFEMSDLAGLDIGQSVRREAARLGLGAFASDWVDELVNMGRLGQKTGAGIYDHASGTPVDSPITAGLVSAYRQAQGIQEHLTPDQAVRRLLFTLANEGATVLEEGVASYASDIDLIYVTGYGFPRLQGGPMYVADQEGLSNVVTALQGWGITPAPLLVQLAAAGKTFAQYDREKANAQP